MDTERNFYTTASSARIHAIAREVLTVPFTIIVPNVEPFKVVWMVDRYTPALDTTAFSTRYTWTELRHVFLLHSDRLTGTSDLQLKVVAIAGDPLNTVQLLLFGAGAQSDHILNKSPELHDHPDRHRVLLDHLNALEKEQFLATPKMSKNWDSNRTPKLPHWILLRRKKKDAKPDAFSIDWVGELAFCAGLKNAKQIDAAKAINDFLITNRGRLNESIPSRERSVEIFGDEKRLDSLFVGGGLFGGKLPLSAVGAFAVPLKVPVEKYSVKRPVLVIENHHTYWSFCQWNEKSRMYSAIMFGGGNMVLSNDEGLLQLLMEVESNDFEYLGDIDERGVAIAESLIDLMFVKHCIVGKPALRFYNWLLDHGIRAPAKKSKQIESNLPARIKRAAKVSSFPADMSARIRQLFESETRVAQECLSLTKLKSDFLHVTGNDS